MDLKTKLIDAACEVCGYTKGKPKHSETLWWNDGVNVAVTKKRELFNPILVGVIESRFRVEGDANLQPLS